MTTTPKATKTTTTTTRAPKASNNLHKAPNKALTAKGRQRGADPASSFAPADFTPAERRVLLYLHKLEGFNVVEVERVRDECGLPSTGDLFTDALTPCLEMGKVGSARWCRLTVHGRLVAGTVEWEEKNKAHDPPPTAEQRALLDHLYELSGRDYGVVVKVKGLLEGARAQGIAPDRVKRLLAGMGPRGWLREGEDVNGRWVSLTPAGEAEVVSVPTGQGSELALMTRARQAQENEERDAAALGVPVPILRAACAAAREIADAVPEPHKGEAAAAGFNRIVQQYKAGEAFVQEIGGIDVATQFLQAVFNVTGLPMPPELETARKRPRAPIARAGGNSKASRGTKRGGK